MQLRTMQLRTKLMAVAMAGGTAALVFSGVPALASSHAPSKPITGPEIASGVIHGKRATANNPIIPVAWRGLVTAHGVFSTGGGPPPRKGQRHTFTTSAGNLRVVVTARPTNTQHFNVKACHFSFATYVVFAVLGGRSTGRFAGTSGPGAVQVRFAGFGPRHKSGPKKGQCNTSPRAPELAKGAVASFRLSAVLRKP
jgi:hypothetical protein